MKKIFQFLFLFTLPSMLVAQTPKFVVLTPENPLIGNWEWVKDPTGSPYSPITETDFIFMRFSPGDSLSVGAISNDESKGLQGHCSFLAYSNGTTVFGTLTGCSNPANNNKTFRFNYTLMGDELHIFVKDEEIIYKRQR
ncbi:hypothetical protein BH09BAC5_BH09BAC5_19420 [soil metagenome]